MDWYDKTLSKIGKALLDLNNLSDPKIVPVTSGYVFSQTHEFLSDVSVSDRVAAPVSMTNVVFGPGVTPTDFDVHYTMDDADISGSSILDSSGNGHTATMSNSPTTGVTGQVNEAISFDGVNQIATMTDHADFKPSNISVAFWVKKSPDSGNQVLLQSYSQNSNYAGWYIFQQVGGALSFVIGSNTGVNLAADWDATATTSIIDDDTWHFFVGTYDGSNIRVYLDGVLENTKAYAGGLAYAATNYVRMCCFNQSGSNLLYFDGTLDQIKLFPRALALDEIERLYANDGGSIILAKEGWLDADDPTIIGPTVDDVIVAFIMFNDTGVEATSPIILYADSGLGLPYTVTTTGSINVQLGADGIAKL